METLVTLSYSHPSEKGSILLVAALINTKKTCKRNEKYSNFLFERRGSVLTWKTTFATWRNSSSAKINCWSFSLNPYFLDRAGLYCTNCLYHPGRISVGEACISYFLMPPPPSPSILYASLWGRARQINEHTISMFSIYVAWEKRCGVLYFDKGNYFLLNTKKKSPPGYWFLRSSNTHSSGCTT